MKVERKVARPIVLLETMTSRSRLLKLRKLLMKLNSANSPRPVVGIQQLVPELVPVLKTNYFFGE